MSVCLEWLSDGSAKIKFPAFTKPTAPLWFAIDPATAAEVVSAAIDYLKNRQESEWKARVGDKLDSILQKMEEILRAVADAVDRIIANNNENWATFYTNNLKGPGMAWEGLAAGNYHLSDNDRTAVAEVFLHEFRQAVQNITLNDDFKKMGYVLSPVVRLVFPYTMLALKLAKNNLSATTAKENVVKFALNYLISSVSENDSASLASALKTIKAEQAEVVSHMETWANNRWVRVSNEVPARYRTIQATGDEIQISPAKVLVAHLDGGANDPKILETRLANDGESLFGAPYYPGFPGSIEPHEDEKARFYLNDRWIAPNVTRRDTLAAKAAVLKDQVEGIQTEIPVIKRWVDSV